MCISQHFRGILGSQIPFQNYRRRILCGAVRVTVFILPHTHIIHEKFFRIHIIGSPGKIDAIGINSKEHTHTVLRGISCAADFIPVNIKSQSGRRPIHRIDVITIIVGALKANLILKLKQVFIIPRMHLRRIDIGIFKGCFQYINFSVLRRHCPICPCIILSTNHPPSYMAATSAVRHFCPHFKITVLTGKRLVWNNPRHISGIRMQHILFNRLN